MKNFIFTITILVLFAFTLVGCTQVSEKASTKQNTESPKQTESPVEKDNKETAETDQKKSANEDDIAITVYKSPTCGCCTSWESHMAKEGFAVTSKPTDKMTDIRKQHKVPEKMQSCHTAIVDGYVIEGHVPASDVKKLLKLRPDVVGLAAPGMPQHSPGMQPEGEKPSGYDVLSFDKQGKTKVFTSY